MRRAFPPSSGLPDIAPAHHAVLLTRALAVILMSHLGRPDGKPNPTMTLKPVADKLGEIM